MPAEHTAGPAVRYLKFETATRQISIRNTGTNALWVSFDRSHFFDIASGTSFDDRMVINGFWYCTQTGITFFVANGISLNVMPSKLPEPTHEELEG